MVAIMKKICIIFLIFLISILMSISHIYAAETGKAKEALKLRKTAQEETTVLEIIPEGDEFEILEKKDTWYQVNYKKIKGYVKAEYVETVLGKEEKQEEQKNDTKEEQKEETKEEEKNDNTNEVTIGKKMSIKQNTSIYIRPLFNSIRVRNSRTKNRSYSDRNLKSLGIYIKKGWDNRLGCKTIFYRRNSIKKRRT